MIKIENYTVGWKYLHSAGKEPGKNSLRKPMRQKDVDIESLR